MANHGTANHPELGTVNHIQSSGPPTIPNSGRPTTFLARDDQPHPELGTTNHPELGTVNHIPSSGQQTIPNSGRPTTSRARDNKPSRTRDGQPHPELRPNQPYLESLGMTKHHSASLGMVNNLIPSHPTDHLIPVAAIILWWTIARHNLYIISRAELVQCMNEKWYHVPKS